MEIANLGATVVRQATAADSKEIFELLQTVPHSHTHVDWHMPADWLGTPGFVVSERPKRAQWSWPGGYRLEACLAAAPDPLPAAWVRMAAIRSLGQPEIPLGAMLEQVLPYLREISVQELAWLSAETWPDRFLPALGFEQRHRIITYVKDDLAFPPLPLAPVTIRPVQKEDMPQLEAMEAAAFDPLWRHSATGLTLGWQQAMSFDVAEWDGRIAGFQYSVRSYTGTGAHLVRMTVHPQAQRMGIGSALLVAALQEYQSQGVGSVSLNTQLDNVASRRLYEKFGFYPAGEPLPVWVLPL